MNIDNPAYLQDIDSPTAEDQSEANDVLTEMDMNLLYHGQSEGLKLIYDFSASPCLMYLGKSEKWENRNEFWYGYNQKDFMFIGF